MARPLRIEYEDAFYHIIQRGIEKKKIFLQDTDRGKFLSYLSQAYLKYRIIIHAYALMDNHYHLILQTPKANLTKAMHYLNTSYAAYFNAKRKRTGPLYQGRYKAILVQQDEYLHHLSRYIHLNPVRAKIVKNPIEYLWSSYKYFVSNAASPAWLQTTFILSMFSKTASQAKKIYKEFVLTGIGKEKDIIFKNTIKGFILGNGDFAEKIIKKFVKGKQNSEIPIINELQYRKEPTLAEIKTRVENKIKDNKKNNKNKRLRRKIILYLARKYTQQTLNQIASFCGKIKDTGVSQAFKRTKQARKKNKELNKLLEELEKEIKV
ncbi:MAG: transposase [Candidatus Omnitrophica bacterium]|nr:transposase [Candidatus Omnitrophota bacterium]MCF7878332.1 transposase [Candidatus Omnitrophota bacterium]